MAKRKLDVTRFEVFDGDTEVACDHVHIYFLEDGQEYMECYKKRSESDVRADVDSILEAILAAMPDDEVPN